MAAKRPTLGVRHPTVVPSNFQPPDDEDEGNDRDHDSDHAA